MRDDYTPEETAYWNGRADERKEWTAKIKAKIEEIKEHIEDMRNIARRKTDRVECRLMSDMINEYLKAEEVLQSLLEKE